ncbi:MAG: hypothetical protein Q4P36_01380 [Bowdeniella nasicola]|nr:hypothetical protein [Bowdeniella nasicola]
MTRLRFRVELDIEVTDRTAAEDRTRRYWTAQVDRTTLQGGSFSFDSDGTPHDAIEELVRSDAALSSSLIAATLSAGQNALGCLRLTNVSISPSVAE